MPDFAPNPPPHAPARKTLTVPRSPTVGDAPQISQNPLRGVMWMLFATLSFVAVNSFVHTVGTQVPTAQSAFIRFLFAWVLLAPAIWALTQRRFPVRVWGLFSLRAVLNTGAVLFWFYAMTHIPMADVTAIGYLTPIVVTLGGAFLLGEGFAWRRGLAIVVALIGALIILRPGLRAVELGHLSELGAAFLFGLAYLTAKHTTRYATPIEIVAMMTVMVSVLLAPFAIAVWQPISVVNLAWIAGAAVFATFGHYCMTMALACAPVTVTQPVTFLQLVWAAATGWLLFGEPVDPYVILGGALIITAISYMTWRERVLRQRGLA